MFDIGAVELMVIGVVAIIVVGPKDLPGMLRSFGQFVSKMRQMAREFQTTFEEAAKDTGIDEITKGVSDVKNLSVTKGIGKIFDPIAEEATSLKSDIEGAGSKAVKSARATKSASTKSARKKKTAKKTTPKTKVAAKKKPVTRKSAPKPKTKQAKPAAMAKS
jgi:sec-independent protein translocase protein TatB